MRLIDADSMKTRIVKAAELSKIITGKNVDEAAGILLSIIEQELTVELKDERLIPKKPKNIYCSTLLLGKDELLYGECPSCKLAVFKSGKTIQRYCPCCGQMLDWREEE